MRRNGKPHLLRQNSRILSLGIRTDDQKLLAAPSSHNIRHPGIVQKQLAEFDQHIVTHLMAEAIIHHLEIIDVDQH